MSSEFPFAASSAARRFPAASPLVVFCLALAGRLLLTLLFFSRFGPRSSQLIEIWYYYGVARGAFTLPALDPTLYLLRLLPLVFSPDRIYSAVAFQAFFLSSLTAVAVYFWFSRRVSRAAGFWAGAVFAVLPAPISLSSANYSHDLVALPIVVSLAVALDFLFRGEKKPGRVLLLSLFSLALLVAGLAVGPLMAAFVVVLLLYLGWLGFDRCWPGGFRPSAPIIYFCVLIAVCAGFYLFARSRLLELIIPLARSMRGIDLRAQMVIGSADLQPLPPAGLWTRYNIFLFLLPAGILCAFRRRDFATLSLFFFSLALSLAVNRGARLLDLGAALLVASAIMFSEKKERAVSLCFLILVPVLSAVFPAAAVALRIEAFSGGPGEYIPRLVETVAGRGFLPGLVTPTGMAALAFVLAVPVVILLKRGPLIPAIALFAAVAAFQWRWVWVSFSPAVVNSEWEAYRWLDERAPPGEKIFAAWNQGFLIRSSTDLDPVTTPDRIDLELPRFYWAEEEAAWREFRRRGIRYLHVNNRYFGLTDIDEERDAFKMFGSTIIGPRPDHIRSLSVMRRTLLYRMIYEPRRLNRFTLVYDRLDPESGVGVRFFLVSPGEVSKPD